MTTRRCKNWLQSLAAHIEETESPRKFWHWAGIFILSSALQRRVWIPFGLENLYPNLFIMIVAPPGRCRKGAPVGFAKKILTEAQLHVFVDSPTKRALTKHLHELAGREAFRIGNKFISQSPLALVSKELSSFMAVNPKEMIEVLTDLFDSHDVWEYKTSEKGTDKLYGPCIGCLFATTPSWMAANLPEEAIGGGFTSRFVLVSGTEKYKLIPIPPIPEDELYRDLLADLVHISTISGEFTWQPQARKLYEKWYFSIGKKVKATRDDRLHGFLERIHIMAIKTAMALHIAESDELILLEEDIAKAILFLEEALRDAPKALSSQGRSDLAIDTDRIAGQLRILGTATKSELMRMNYRNVRPDQLNEILDALSTMRTIRFDGGNKITWVGAKNSIEDDKALEDDD